MPSPIELDDLGRAWPCESSELFSDRVLVFTSRGPACKSIFCYGKLSQLLTRVSYTDFNLGREYLYETIVEYPLIY